jgi:GNAT superfamily N-acetyltransferase
MEYIIRPAMLSDMSELLKLIAEHAAYEQAPFAAENKQERLARAIFEQPVRLHCEVVEENKKLVGYVSYTYDYSTWQAAEYMYMDCLFLRPETRGKGIGGKILKKLQAIARAKGCVNIQWQTPEFNAPAIGFYKKAGASHLNKIRFTYTP